MVSHVFRKPTSEIDNNNMYLGLGDPVKWTRRNYEFILPLRCKSPSLQCGFGCVRKSCVLYMTCHREYADFCISRY